MIEFIFRLLGYRHVLGMSKHTEVPRRVFIPSEWTEEDLLSFAARRMREHEMVMAERGRKVVTTDLGDVVSVGIHDGAPNVKNIPGIAQEDI